jgi:hypothetical protein
MMKPLIAAGLLTGVLCGAHVMAAQTAASPAPPSAGSPPNVVLLVHQQFLPGKAGERERLELETCRKFDEFAIPIPWIEMEAVTGTPGALFFDPANSFDEVDRAGQLLSEMYGAHPELAQLQNGIEELIASSKTVFARRREDLGNLVDRMDLSKAHYWRITVVNMRPGRDNDFVEADKARVRAQRDTPWVVYEVDSGTTLPTFLVIETLRSFADADRKPESTSAANKGQKDRDQVVKDAYLSVESNLYGVHPEMSHVSKPFAAGEPEFWSPAPAK